jgi:GNAT superfamily N-acetyltransferase
MSPLSQTPADRRFSILGLHTDVAIVEMEGATVTDVGPCTAIVSPHNPTFFWGNFLIFPEPPTDGVLEEWEALFDKHVGSKEHKTFAWDSSDKGELDQFVAAGYDVENAVTLAVRKDEIVVPPRWAVGLEIRPCESQADWTQSTELSVLTREKGHSEAAHRKYALARTRAREEMIARGSGQWFGAWYEGELVAELGIFDTGAGIARFQSVTTHPKYRRRGICSRLVHHASEWAFENLPVEQLVMLADAEYHAARIYESVGFRPVEHWTGVVWWVRGEDA